MSHLTAIDSCFSHCDYMLATFWSCSKDSLQGICFFSILSSGFLYISITCMHTVLEIFHCITQQYSAVSDANRDISFCHFKPDRHISQMVLILPVSHTTLDMMLTCVCGKLQTVNCEDTAILFQYWTFLSDKLRQIAEGTNVNKELVLTIQSIWSLILVIFYCWPHWKVQTSRYSHATSLGALYSCEFQTPPSWLVTGI